MLYDYLDLLLQALRNQHLRYNVAGIIRNVDVEIPMFWGMDGEIPVFADIRLTDFDVILVREDVIYTNVFAENYEYGIDLPELGLYIPRGYVAIDAEVHGKVPVGVVLCLSGPRRPDAGPCCSGGRR